MVVDFFGLLVLGTDMIGRASIDMDDGADIVVVCCCCYLL